jgi:DNA-binding CsgD family transcriptional regulator/tetratricopeptide (TPR) repeat protein
MYSRLDFLLAPGYADAGGAPTPHAKDESDTVSAQVETTESELPQAQRHIIKRPRLTRLLDEAEARVLLLVAPAGYGKTTLAREWTTSRGRTPHWFRARSEGISVVTAAQGLAAALAGLAPRAERAVIEFAAATPDPEGRPDDLADLLAQEMDEWPPDSWLVIDEYEALMRHTAAERLVLRFIQRSNPHVLITSRERPSWIAPRQLLYGEALEIGRHALAMTIDEAANVLRNARSEAAGIVALADGWPAVIGLAALLPGIGSRAASPVPEELYDFLAQELYERLSPTTKQQLPWLAVPATFDRRLAEEMLGIEIFDTVIQDAHTAGFISIRDDSEMEMHPLARAFLRRKLERPLHDREESRRRILCLVRAARWDDAFEAVRRFHTPEVLPELIRESFDAMLGQGRLATLAEWTYWGEGEAGIEAPELSLVRAETALRHGDWHLAEALALSTVGTSSEKGIVARGLLCAGLALNLLDEVQRAKTYFARSLELDDSPIVQRTALWGSFLASTVENDDSWQAALQRLEEARDSSPTHLVRLQQARMIGALRQGGLENAASMGLATEPMLDLVSDPIVRTGFLNSLADILVMAGRYRDAERVANRELRESERFRLEFVAPNATLTIAAAKCGQGRYTGSLALIERALRIDRERDPFVTTNSVGLRVRVHLSLGNLDQALHSASDLGVVARDDIHSEVCAVSAFACALGGLTDQALRHLAVARRCTWFAATRVFIAATEIALAERANGSIRPSLVAAFAEEVERTGHLDSAVCVLRAWPLLAESIQATAHRHVLVSAAQASNDRRLAVAAGIDARSSTRGVDLSQREIEVLELVAQGLRNAQVAERLVISDLTVKSHLQHVYEKLEVGSRTEAVARARERGLLG